MKTPSLDSLINDLETYDRMDMISDNGRSQLNEYRAIKEALRMHDVAGRSEQLPCEHEWIDIRSKHMSVQQCEKCGDHNTKAR